jgi:hypothetical protein
LVGALQHRVVEQAVRLALDWTWLGELLDAAYRGDYEFRADEFVVEFAPVHDFESVMRDLVLRYLEPDVLSAVNHLQESPALQSAARKWFHDHRDLVGDVLSVPTWIRRWIQREATRAVLSVPTLLPPETELAGFTLGEAQRYWGWLVGETQLSHPVAEIVGASGAVQRIPKVALVPELAEAARDLSCNHQKRIAAVQSFVDLMTHTPDADTSVATTPLLVDQVDYVLCPLLFEPDIVEDLLLRRLAQRHGGLGAVGHAVGRRTEELLHDALVQVPGVLAPRACRLLRATDELSAKLTRYLLILART